MIKVFNNISLRERNSFRIEATAKRLIEFDSAEDLREIFASIHRDAEPWMVLSGGNNILFTKDVDITLLTPTATNITIVCEDDKNVTIRVEAGAEWDDVVEWCVTRNLWGAENLSLIPGKAGAAPIQNIGAYGVEVCQLIRRVEYFDPSEGLTKWIDRDMCRFGYRNSIFKEELKGQVVVTAIELTLSKEPNPRLNYADVAERVSARGEATLRNIRDVIVEVRRSKLPDPEELGNAGSFFKNPIVALEKAKKIGEQYPQAPIYPVAGDQTQAKLAAGWLIDRAEMKGYREGCVGVHSTQALVLVNHGGATGSEVVALARKVQKVVKERFDIEIEAEVNII